MLPAILLALQVAQASGTPPIVIPEIVNRARVDAAKVVDVHAMLVPDTVYVGQQSTYQLGVFMESVTRQRMRRNPEYVAPDVRDLLAYDVRDTPRGFVREVGNHPYEVHVFRRAIFALAPGTVEIPAARLSYALPQGGSYFSREESFTMRSEALRLTVIEPPAAGRPSEWRGAVGVYRVSATIGTTRAKAGDPLILTLRVEGQGNVTLLPRPPVELTWGTVISAGERVSVDSAPAALRGAKEFDWIVTPRSAGAQYVPALRFAYFNPFARRYEIAVSTPILKQVEVGDVVASVAPVVEAPSSPPLPILRAFAPERAPPLGQMWWYVVLVLCAPVPAAAVFWRTRPRTAKAPLTAWERAHALAGRDAGFDEGVDQAATVRRAFLDAIRERTGLDAAHLTTAGAWERALCLEGVTPGTARTTAEMLRDLDAASFHPRHLAPDDVHSRVGTLLRAIDREARGPRAGRARWVGRRFRPRRVPAAAICFFVAIAAGPVVAATIDRARADFTAGVASYDRGDFRRSAQHFADAAREAPRSREAWANFGTASWAASDSANAVVGWQRALRLAPTDGDLRSRLARVRAPQDSGVARVPDVPVHLPALLTLIVWFAGWTQVARRRARGRPSGLLPIVTLVVGAALLTATARWERTLLARDLVVIVVPGALRTLPALGAEHGPVPLAGETAQVDARQGVWSHVVLDESRAGWIPTEQLAALGAP